MVVGWNVKDYVEGKGDYNIRQIPLAIPWAVYGHERYNEKY